MKRKYQICMLAGILMFANCYSQNNMQKADDYETIMAKWFTRQIALIDSDVENKSTVNEINTKVSSLCDRLSELIRYHDDFFYVLYCRYEASAAAGVLSHDYRFGTNKANITGNWILNDMFMRLVRVSEMWNVTYNNDIALCYTTFIDHTSPDYSRWASILIQTDSISLFTDKSKYDTGCLGCPESVGAIIIYESLGEVTGPIVFRQIKDGKIIRELSRKDATNISSDIQQGDAVTYYRTIILFPYQQLAPFLTKGSSVGLKYYVNGKEITMDMENEGFLNF